MDNGWIKLHRKITENPIIQRPVYFALWIMLLLKANHKENKMMWNGGIIVIKEGQMITGRKELSKETNIPESTIEDILKYLETQHQIQQQKTTKYRLITIVNWKDYQKPDTKSNNKATTKQQQADTNKNDKNVKNDKNIERDAHSNNINQFSFFNGIRDLIENKETEESELMRKFLQSLVEKYPKATKELLWTEIKKFYNYWTEMNSTGTKQRWQKQTVFQVDRRLLTWFGRINQFQGSNIKKRTISVFKPEKDDL